MALNIPLPGVMGDTFGKALDSGSSIFSRLIQPIIAREQLKQKTEHEKQALEQAENHFNRQESRLGANSGLQRQLLQQKILENKLKSDPKALYAFIQAIKNQGNALPGNQQSEMPQQEMPMQPYNGRGMPNNEEIEHPIVPIGEPKNQQVSQSQKSNGLFDNLTPDQQAMLSIAGVKIPTVKENPADKRYAELRDKLQLEDYRAKQAKLLTQEQANLKDDSKRKAIIDSAKADLPHLESTLKALNKMKIIAKNNPDLFGHNGIFGYGAEAAAERFAKTTTNKNAGAWQTYGLNPIVAAEMKMSSKGNQLALKQALSNKANFSETQPVAMSKIDANIDIIKDAIKENRKITGERVAPTDGFALMIDPEDNQAYKVPSKDVEMRLKEKWHRV